jgi:hypothetical protein
MFDRDWIAGSTTAMDITGDARLTPTSITFDRRITYKLRYLSEIAATRPEALDGIRQFSLFKFVDPKPQALLHGAHLCSPWKGPDETLSRYLAAGLSRESERRSDFLLIVVFKSERPPEDAAQQEGFCGDLLSETIDASPTAASAGARPAS